MEERKKLTSGEVNLYALSGFAQTLGIRVPMTYISIFMTDFLLISATTMGTTLVIAKTLDFIVAMVAGAVIEKTNMKWGKYISWIRVLTFALFFGSILHFLPTQGLPELVRCAIILIGYCCIHCSMNFLATARGGIISLMAGADMEQRRVLTTRQAQFNAFGGIAISAITLPTIKFMQPFVGEAGGYLVVAIAFAAVNLFISLTFCKKAQPFDLPAARGAAKQAVSVKDMITSITSNPQMRVLLIVYTLFGIGTQTYTGLIAYYFKVVTGKYMMMALCTTIRGCVAFVASLFVPKLGKKLGKKKALITGMGLYALSMLGLGLFGLKSIWIFTAFMCLNMSAGYIYMSFGANYWIDCGEYGFFHTGKDLRPVAISMMNIPTKIGMIVGAAVLSYGLAAIGYAAGIEVTVDFQKKFMILIGVLPAVFQFAAVAVAALFYKLTDEEAAKYAKANAEKVAAERAAAAAK